jgi:hypothetical protein
MKTSKRTTFGALFALTLATGATILYLRQNTIAGLRAENQAVTISSQEAARLARENGMIARLREEDIEAQKLREENKDVLKLRNDAGQLREELAALSKPLASLATPEPQPASPEVASNLRLIQQNYFTKDTLSDQGFNIPRATIQTYYWAMREGDVKKAMECLTPSAQASWQSQSEDLLRQQMLETMRSFTGYNITGRTVPSPGEIILSIQLNGTGETQQMHFKLIDGQWKIDQ